MGSRFGIGFRDKNFSIGIEILDSGFGTEFWDWNLVSVLEIGIRNLSFVIRDRDLRFLFSVFEIGIRIEILGYD